MKKKKTYKQAQLDFTGTTTREIPPQAKDVEEAVIGAIMLEKSASDTVVEILKRECIYVNGHKPVFFKWIKTVENEKQDVPEEKNEMISVHLGAFRLNLINPSKKAMLYVLVAMGFIIVIITLFFVLNYYL